MNNDILTWLSNMNCNATVTYNGNKFSLSIDEIKSLYSKLNYWHSPGNPGSWLCTSMVSLVKRKFSNTLPRDKALELCALIMQMEVSQIEDTLEWNANYMAWHDGGSANEFHIWPEDE